MDFAEAEGLDMATVITVGELRPAIKRVLQEHFSSVDLNGADADVIATDVIRSVMNAREPVFEVDDVVRDANGKVWRRHTASQWQMMGQAGVYRHLDPERPLTLLDSPRGRKTNKDYLAALERARDDGAPI